MAITAPTTTPANPAATTTAPAAPAPAAPAAGTAPTATGTGVYGLPITAQVTGSPVALGQFLQQLQAVQPRAVLITKLIEGTGPVAGSKLAGTSLQLTMQAFVAPAATPVAAN